MNFPAGLFYTANLSAVFLHGALGILDWLTQRQANSSCALKLYLLYLLLLMIFSPALPSGILKIKPFYLT